jgi:Mn-dependent DtxR family transcriptional regulator
MLPSSTVENYLKAIHQGQSSLGRDQRLVPMGQVASALGVTPGTATTMVKALAESGLAEYEPYSGVRLSAAGEKLAGLVLRRHRLVEAFLVQVMGMSWAEVHDEAEHLEHVVSERLIDRIDAMLGGRLTTRMAIRFPTPMAPSRRAPRQPAHVRARHVAEGHAHHRSGPGVSALHREQRPEARAAGRGRKPRRGRRLGDAARQGRTPDHDRRARGVEASRGAVRSLKSEV